MCHLSDIHHISLVSGFQIFHFSPWLKAGSIRKVCDILHPSFIIIFYVFSCFCLFHFYSVILNPCRYFTFGWTLFFLKKPYQSISLISFVLAFYFLIEYSPDPSPNHSLATVTRRAGPVEQYWAFNEVGSWFLFFNLSKKKANNILKSVFLLFS